MNIYTILGYLAIPLIDLSGIFQIFRLIKRKQAEDISFLWSFSLFVGSLFLFLHFWNIKDAIGIICNFVCVFVTLIIMFLTLKYRGRINLW